MNIVNINKPLKTFSTTKSLFAKLECSLSGSANFERSVRLAKTLAPVLCDTSANNRHLAIINSNQASTQEKVIAIIMLGFPNNRPALPILKDICLNGSDSMRMAAAIAISQMQDGHNNELLSDILLSAFKKSDSTEVKKTLRKTIMSLMDQKSAKMVSVLFHDQF